MRRALLVAALAFGWAGCGDPRPQRPYSQNDLQLITGYTAKAVCSCLFVEGRSEADCAAYAKQSPAVTTWSADHGTKSVDATAGLMWNARARWVGARFGCKLE